MKHIENISALLETLQKSTKFHSLIIQSPPGWAKSTTIDRLLREKQLSFRSLGSYSTPLALYNILCETNESFLVIDDCAGLFTDPISLSILKAATWPTGNTPERIIRWATTSDKAVKSDAVFSGKLILLTNTVPASDEMRAFLSRALFLKIVFSNAEIMTLLCDAANSAVHFENTDCSKRVAEFLCSLVDNGSTTDMNLRTLHLGYELALTHPDGWQELLDRLLPTKNPRSLARRLSESTIPVEQQVKDFCRETGLSRRTYFNYRQQEISRGGESVIAGEYTISSS